MTKGNKINKKKKGGDFMVILKNVSKSFGEYPVLCNVNLVIAGHKKVALVGPNGSGKSTLLKIAAKILEPDEGKVETSTEAKISYFPQEIPKETQDKTAIELLAESMGASRDKVAGTFGILCKKLRFPLAKIDLPVASLSGGEKSKLMLMIILKSSADIFLLDEPTNNLDLLGLLVLESFIAKSSRGFLIVSHDRKFLDKLVNEVVEINEEAHNLEIYTSCSYSQYLIERTKKERKELKDYEIYEREQRRLLETAQRKNQEAMAMARGPKQRRDNDKYIVGFKKDRSKKIASQSSVLEKRAKKIEEVKRPKFHLPLNLSFGFLERGGDIVFRLTGVELECSRLHFGPVDLEIHFGDRVAVIGPNGEGKSTLLKMLIGEIKPAKGIIQIGSRVKIGYLPQETLFKEGDTVLSYFLRIANKEQSDGRKILARFGFAADDVKQNIRYLSQGERSRLVLATLMAQEINCLILDEPTNHLDPEALDRLEYALQNFSGTILIVSHDRYLLDKIKINKTYLMESGKISLLQDYHEYEKRIILEK